MMKRSVMALFVVGVSWACGCSEPAEADNNSDGASNNAQATLCERACAVIGPCAGVSQAMCEAQCPQLAASLLQCAADAPSCAAADQCGAQQPADMGGQDMSGQDMGGQQDMNNENPDPCSRCGAMQVCVRQGQSYSCKDTVQSCNNDLFPDICDCLYDNVGPSTEGRALCADGVTSCSIIGGQLKVDCR